MDLITAAAVTTDAAAAVAAGAVPVVEQSDTVQILGMVLAFITAMFGALMTYLLARLTQQSTVAAAQRVVAAEKVAEVKTTLIDTSKVAEKKMDAITSLAVTTHALVNSQHGVALKMNMELSEWKASQTHDPVDIAKAAAARKLNDEHIVAQAKADAATGAA